MNARGTGWGVRSYRRGGMAELALPCLARPVPVAGGDRSGWRVRPEYEYAGTFAAMAHNLLRAAGIRAGTRYAKARTSAGWG